MFIPNFIKKYTTGAPFAVFFAAGFLFTLFFIALYLLREFGYTDISTVHHIDFQKIWYVIIFSGIWFIASDIIKKKGVFPQSVHFFIDGIFYLATFGFIIYYTEGLHAGFYPLFFLAAIAAAIFGNTAQIFIFVALLSVETYALYFLTQKANERDIYHIALLAFYVFFYFFLAWIVQFFYRKVRENEKKYADLFETAQSAGEKYRDLIENTPLCVKVFDGKGNLIFLNKGGRDEHFIKDTDDVSKWDWLATVKEEYRAKAKELFERALKGEASAVEFEHTPEGSKHGWCSGIISPIKDKNGDIKSILFYSADITALKKAEIEAKRNEAMFRALLDATPLCIKWFGAKGNLISINKSGREEHFLEKLSEEEIKKWNYWDCIEKEYHPLVKEKMDLALKGAPGEFLMKHVPGTSKSAWCQSALVPVKDEKEKVNYILFISRDVTQEKSIEEERKEFLKKTEDTKVALFNILEDAKESEKNLKEERDRSQGIISSMGEGLFVVDGKCNIALMNAAAEKLFGVKAEESIGKHWRDLIMVYQGETETPKEKCFVLDVLKENKTIDIGLEDNFYFKNNLGKKFPVIVTITPLYIGKDAHAIVVFQDVGREKALEEARTSFISIASHQLRTPLTSIRWYAEMLDAGDAGALNENQKDFVKRVYSGALKLNEVINLLLTLARIESGKTESEPVEINLVSFTEDAFKELEPQIKQKKLEVKIIQPDEKQPPTVKFDASMLRQIVVNLLSNSIRYTDISGKIEVEIKKEQREIIYSVKDDGIGIPENRQDKIFSKFFRAENAINKVPDGSGLGLSLVKSLVELNNGKIWFESPATWVGEGGKEEKKGAVFHFTVPIK